MSTRITATETEKYIATVRYYSKEEEYVLKIIDIDTAIPLLEAVFVKLEEALEATRLIMQGFEALEEQQSARF